MNKSASERVGQGAKLNSLLERLYARQNFGIKMGLDVEEAILAQMGNPERSFSCVHVAGTNGKGSICALLDSILRTGGLKVGLYTSPHLIRFNERITVDGREVSDEELGCLFEKTEPHVLAVAQEKGREPTFFECTTAMAFEHFRSQGVQTAVLETGLGGRLDATNVVMPLVSVISRISIEHTAYLGKDIESIAKEKCGIIKSGRPVVCGAMDEVAKAVVRQTARQRGSPLVEADQVISASVVSSDLAGQRVKVETQSSSYGILDLPLIGKHQIENLATAVTAIETLNATAGFRIDEAAVKKGVSNVKWPGRFQVLSKDPVIILDGAHNPCAGVSLAGALKQHLKGKRLGLIVGMCNDKDVEHFLQSFTGMVAKCWTVPIRSERSLAPSTIAGTARSLGWDTAETSLQTALIDVRKWAKEENGAVCICGSLFLAGEVLELREKESSKTHE